ncbi:MAG: YqgE/AlgH family protein [Planctomycetia bacterium]|nr:YqgE/AlgH family protein [Planctomycetia bacterium]
MPFYSGSFLVARPILQDPNFTQTVVLLLRHAQEGAFGLVVNRPAQVEGLAFPVYGGGPCKAEGLMLLHGHEDWIASPAERQEREVAPGIYLGDSAALKRSTEATPEDGLRFRIFSGYSGWGPGQLEAELAAGAWTIAGAKGETLFDVPAEDLWERLIPPRIPQPSLN